MSVRDPNPHTSTLPRTFMKPKSRKQTRFRRKKAAVMISTATTWFACTTAPSFSHSPLIVHS